MDEGGEVYVRREHQVDWRIASGLVEVLVPDFAGAVAAERARRAEVDQ